MKYCNKCQTQKPLDQFYVNKAKSDGRAGDCKVCVKARANAWYHSNKERAAATMKTYREENKEACVARAQAWAEENREKSRQIKAAWKKRNPETVNRHAREGARRNSEKQAVRKKIYREANPHVARAYTQKRRAENPHQRVHDAMGNRFRDVLRSNKGGKSWRELAGYGVKELRAHLEKQFVDGMTWDNYGEWHIDHIRPVVSFDFEVEFEKTVRACWALTNLQPLWAIDNIKKGKKWDGVINDNS